MAGYGECMTCAYRDNPVCIGCSPMMRSDGTFTRSMYTPHKAEISFTAQAPTGAEVEPMRKALKEIRDMAVAGVYDGTCDCHEIIRVAEVALGERKEES